MGPHSSAAALLCCRTTASSRHYSVRRDFLVKHWRSEGVEKGVVSAEGEYKIRPYSKRLHKTVGANTRFAPFPTPSAKRPLAARHGWGTAATLAEQEAERDARSPFPGTPWPRWANLAVDSVEVLPAMALPLYHILEPPRLPDKGAIVDHAAGALPMRGQVGVRLCPDALGGRGAKGGQGLIAHGHLL